MANRGFRPIVVGAHRLRWRFAPGAVDSTLTVVGPGGRLVVTLVGWRDPWLTLTGATVDGAELVLTTAAVNDPPIVGPGFVRAAIEAALALGWAPAARGPGFDLAHREGQFVRGA